MAAVAVALSPPPPEPPALRRGLPLPVPAAARALAYLYLASNWVFFAAVAAATVARRAWGLDSPVSDALLKTSFGAAFSIALVLVAHSLLLLRAVRATGLSLSTWVKEFLAKVKEILVRKVHSSNCDDTEGFMSTSRKVFRALLQEMLRDTAFRGLLVCVPFVLLLVAAAVVFMGLSPVEGSQKERIGYALYDVGVLGASAMCCFVILPCLALKLWKLKKRGDTAQHCNI